MRGRMEIDFARMSEKEILVYLVGQVENLQTGFSTVQTRQSNMATQLQEIGANCDFFPGKYSTGKGPMDRIRGIERGLFQIKTLFLGVILVTAVQIGQTSGILSALLKFFK